VTWWPKGRIRQPVVPFRGTWSTGKRLEERHWAGEAHDALCRVCARGEDPNVGSNLLYLQHI
jgi:hypothetical protein